MKKRDPIAEYCRDWVRWTQSRRFYFNPPTHGLLARLMPSKSSGEAPDARNHPGMQYFNMAIHTLLDMPSWAAESKTFIAHYAGKGEVVKVVADRLGIAPRTYYVHLQRFSKAAYDMAHSIMKVQEQMAPANAAERANAID